MSMTVTHKASVEGKFTPVSQLTIKDLNDLLGSAMDHGMTDDAKVTVRLYQGDQRDPSELTVTISEDVEQT